MFGNIGPAEFLILLTVLVVVLGKKKTTEIARDAGEARREFHKVSQEALEAMEEIKNMEKVEAAQDQSAKVSSPQQPASNPTVGEPTAKQLDRKMIEEARSPEPKEKA
ncbi:hypothetical protein A2797_01760 [candidate division WWE3 bacterium RIFCSPHIGHO2_01_FULL_48_15]|uniref:Sec-independent protein translocase protein TatA n=1 Tax=candidate division WWE3 bacterium RIFCSPHIGHO2_01_FULL_48_15 TaxID=1802619 RepID=A0A1F4VBI7_UNCKA|nr:MAG: hypothetical protein A2797_01760 [candidate division WWE3 bacterium RIFCSPHIGHO2_01_FULL_48_15]